MWTLPSRLGRSGRDVLPSYSPYLKVHRSRQCSTCKRMFTNLDDLQKHVTLSHNGERPHACSQCGLRFDKSVHLKNHMQLHLGFPSPIHRTGFESRGVRSEPYKPTSSSRNGINVTGRKAYAYERSSPMDSANASFGTNQRFTIASSSRSAISAPQLPGRALSQNMDIMTRSSPLWRPMGSSYVNPNTERVVKKLFRLPAMFDRDSDKPYGNFL